MPIIVVSEGKVDTQYRVGLVERQRNKGRNVAVADWKRSLNLTTSLHFRGRFDLLQSKFLKKRRF